jgi:twitching motility protein PilI
MTKETTKTPIQILQDIEQRSRSNARGLPKQEEVLDEWSGIGFRIGNQHLVVPLGEVLEILTYPRLSKVPGAKSWVLGIANIRGNLLPVMDLSGFLGEQLTKLNKRSRVLVINNVVNNKDSYSGLLVDEVLGLRHFYEEEQTTQLPMSDMSVLPYVDRAYKKGDKHWIVFSMHKLTQSDLFMQIAV